MVWSGVTDLVAFPQAVTQHERRGVSMDAHDEIHIALRGVEGIAPPVPKILRVTERLTVPVGRRVEYRTVRGCEGLHPLVARRSGDGCRAEQVWRGPGRYEAGGAGEESADESTPRRCRLMRVVVANHHPLR